MKIYFYFFLIVMSLVMALCSFLNFTKYISASGIILEIAALLQLNIAGVFDKIFEKYTDIEKFPGGPPSHITRELIRIGNPEQPLRSSIRCYLLQDGRAGIHMIILGLLLQLAGTFYA